MDKEFVTNFLLSAVSATQAAAIACLPWIGKGQEIEADQAAVDAMRKALNKLPITGQIVIGEGERDLAPMLYIGEQVGKLTNIVLDIALDPLEGTTLCSKHKANAMSVIAYAAKDQLLNAPDVYMDKIVVGGDLPIGVVNLDDSPKRNLINLARAKKLEIDQLTVAILDRPRHIELISLVRESGARIKLIDDGDIAASIATISKNEQIDMYLGIGGAPEGVLAAAALKAMNAQMQARLLFNDDQQKERARKMGIDDLNKIYNIDQMIKGDTIFCATGVTDGWLLDGVKVASNQIITNSIITSSMDNTIYNLKKYHIVE